MFLSYVLFCPWAENNITKERKNQNVYRRVERRSFRRRKASDYLFRHYEYDVRNAKHDGGRRNVCSGCVYIDIFSGFQRYDRYYYLYLGCGTD